MARSPRQSSTAITLPKRAPAVVVKTEREAALANLSRIAVVPAHACVHPSVCTSPRALQVLILLCAHADKSGLTRVGQARIATLAGCSQQTISYALKKLIASGFVRKEYKRPSSNGHAMNIMRVIFDPELTRQDAKSIAAPQQSKKMASNHPSMMSNGDTNATITNAALVSPDLSTVTNPQCSTITHFEGSRITNPMMGKNYELLKNRTNGLKSAEAVLLHWHTCAMIHDQPNVIANEADLAIAHQIVASGITASQLEDAIVDNPNARLEPIVRSLLP